MKVLHLAVVAALTLVSSAALAADNFPFNVTRPTGSVTGVLAAGGSSDVSVKQNSTYNAVGVIQVGPRSNATIEQTGKANGAIVTQHGGQNSVVLGQFGGGHNVGGIRQSGPSNTASLGQFGRFNLGSISQARR
jgi:hypothetical protein